MKIVFFISLFLTTPFLIAQEENNYLDENSDSIEIEQPDTNHYYQGFFIQAMAAPYFTSNVFTRTNINDYNNPVDMASLYTEKPSYIMAVNFGYTAKDWLVHTGIQYTKTSSDFCLVEARDVIVGNDTSTVDVQTEWVNRYEYLHVPLAFGYVMHYNHWTADIKAGMYFSFNLSKEGYTYDFSKKELILLEENFNPVLISFSLGANLKYQFTNRFRIFLEPYYISGINSIWKSSPVYAWKQIHYGASIGFEYLLGE